MRLSVEQIILINHVLFHTKFRFECVLPAGESAIIIL